MVDLTRAEIDSILAFHSYGKIATRNCSRAISQLLAQLDAATARADAAEKEGFALAAWQCTFTDGKTGLTSDDYGNQFCNMQRRADAAAGQMRERCAAFCKENEVGLSARDGYVISARHELSGGTHPGMKYSEALSALPLHEEPTP